MKRAALPLTFLLAGLLLQGCTWIRNWGDPEPGDPAPLVEFEPSLEVRKVWSTSIGDGMGKQGLSMGPVFSSGMLYAADYEGVLVAVEGDSGRKAWDLKTKQPFSGGPGLDSERLYMGTVDGRVIAYDRNGGAELWNFENSNMWFGTNNQRRMTITSNASRCSTLVSTCNSPASKSESCAPVWDSA